MIEEVFGDLNALVSEDCGQARTDAANVGDRGFEVGHSMDGIGAGLAESAGLAELAELIKDDWDLSVRLRDAVGMGREKGCVAAFWPKRGGRGCFCVKFLVCC